MHPLKSSGSTPSRVRGGHPTGAQHKKSPSQIEIFLRRANEAGVKIKEGDWYVVSVNEEVKICEED